MPGMMQSRAWKTVSAFNITDKDVVVTFTAHPEGTTPYVIGGLKP